MSMLTEIKFKTFFEKFIQTMFFIMFFNLSFSQNLIQTDSISRDCKILHEGTFVYDTGEKLIKVVIQGNRHIEYHNGGKYYIKSKIEWVNDCEYNMTMLENNIPNFPYRPGDVMNVKIDKVEGNKIYYTSTVKGERWNGILVKIK